MQQILWAEIIVKGILGAVLFAAPQAASAVFGMQRPATGFWPRVLGGTVLGIAAGVWIGLKFPNAHGAIGPAGLIPINLFAAAALIAPLILGTAAPSRRGKVVIAVCAFLLLALAFLEIAHA